MDYVKRPKSSWPPRPVVALAVHQSVVHVLAPSVRTVPLLLLSTFVSPRQFRLTMLRVPRRASSTRTSTGLSSFSFRDASSENKMILNTLYGRGTTPEKWVARSDSKGSLKASELMSSEDCLWVVGILCMRNCSSRRQS